MEKLLRHLTLTHKMFLFIGSMMILSIIVFGGYEVPVGISRRNTERENAFRITSNIIYNTIETALTTKRVDVNESLEKFYTILNENNIVFEIYDNRLYRPVLSPEDTALYTASEKDPLNKITQHIIEDETWLITKSNTPTDDYTVVIGQNISTDVSIGMTQLITSFSFAFLMLFVVGFAASQFIKRVIINPIHNIEKAALNISHGNFNARSNLKGKDEISILGNQINNMADQLSSYIKRLKDVDKIKDEFIKIASHNLRTPVTRLKGGVELLQTTKEYDPEVLNQMKETVHQLSYLSEGLLDIVSLETKDEDLNTTAIDIRKSLQFALRLQQKRIFKKDIQVNYSEPQNEVLTMGVTSWLTQAFEHIIENAAKFSKEKGVIDIRLDDSTGNPIITITDKGIGIKPEVLPTLFNKFHRGVESLSGDYPGMGLGLYLSKLIIDEHGGTLLIESEYGHGTTVTIKLPSTQKKHAMHRKN